MRKTYTGFAGLPRFPYLGSSFQKIKNMQKKIDTQKTVIDRQHKFISALLAKKIENTKVGIKIIPKNTEICMY